MALVRRSSKRSSTLPQLAAAMLAFAVCAAVLEAGGLLDWAQRLDLGALRSTALPVATKWSALMAPTGIGAVRTKSITGLARAGWSDDPAAAEGGAAVAPGAASVTLPIPPPGQPGVVPESKLTPPGPATPAAPTLPMAGDPPLLSDLPTLAPLTAPRTRIVALAGDSMMAVGVAEMLFRQSPKYPGLHFVKAFKSGTGLARPEVFNWQKEYPAMLATALPAGHPDVVLVAIGANDGQGFVENGVTYPMGSDGWKTIYQARVAAYLKMLQATGAQVVWLGLPPMKSQVYNAHIALVNRIAYTVVQANPQASWYSTAGVIGDKDGAFRDFGPVAGKQTRLRAADGIHMSDEGASLVTDKLFAWLSPPPPPPATATTPEAKP